MRAEHPRHGTPSPRERVSQPVQSTLSRRAHVFTISVANDLSLFTHTEDASSPKTRFLRLLSSRHRWKSEQKRQSTYRQQTNGSDQNVCCSGVFAQNKVPSIDGALGFGPYHCASLRIEFATLEQWATSVIIYTNTASLKVIVAAHEAHIHFKGCVLPVYRTQFVESCAFRYLLPLEIASMKTGVRWPSHECSRRGICLIQSRGRRN